MPLACLRVPPSASGCLCVPPSATDHGALIASVIRYEVARDAARLATGEQWPGGISATMEAKLHRVKNYRRALSTTEKELQALRAESAENAKKGRQGEVHQRR